MKVLLMTLVLGLSFNTFAAEKKTTEKMGKEVDRFTTTTQLDDLIRGEMAAVKAYDSVVTKVKDEKELTKLKTIRQNHVDAVAKLKTFANKDVKEDTKSAGVWGAFASAYTGGAKLMGDKTALKALRQGEEHGISEYKEALKDETIKPELKQMIRTQFLPKQEEHIETINKFM